MSNPNAEFDPVFAQLINLINTQREIIHELADYLDQLEIGGGGGGGGGGSSAFQPYRSGAVYKKYDTVVDPDTMISYITTVTSFTASNIQSDVDAGKLKLVGYDSQIITFDHPPTAEEINTLPENAIVVEFDPEDTPYTGILSDDINR